MPKRLSPARSPRSRSPEAVRGILFPSSVGPLFLIPTALFSGEAGDDNNHVKTFTNTRVEERRHVPWHHLSKLTQDQ